MVKELPGHEKECNDGNDRDGSLYKGGQNLADLKGATLYSYWPTVNDNFIRDCMPDYIPSRKENTVEDLFKREGIGFIRTISADAFLAEQLINELKQRGVNILSEEEDDKSCKPTIALISEWDTIYGRTLPRIFAAVAKNMKRNSEKPITDGLDADINKLRRDEWPKRIVRYSYLAGLDGELPPKKDSDEAIKTKDKKSAGSKDPTVRQAMEKAAEGRDQLDYLQRMVVDLKMMEDGFNNDAEDCDHNPKSFYNKLLEKKRGFKAIGVLGNDVYDKLLILQALKKEFPQAIFFTIDLDARLLHPQKREWTRNLIVASNFGLQLHPNLQSTIPPFRDNSQTALFYSVFQALGHLKRIETPVEKATHLELAGSWPDCSTPSDGCFSAKTKPKLYEIGRDTAVDISPDLPSSKEFKSIHTVRPDVNEEGVRPPVGVETIIWAFIALISLVFCLIFISDGVKKFIMQNRLENPLKNPLKNPFTSDVYVVLAILVMLVRLELWARRSDGAKGEPLVLTQGVSVWPAIAIQVLAIGLCICFYLHSRHLLNEHDKKLSDKFGLPSRAETTTRANQADSRTIPAYCKYFWNRCFSIPRWHETEDETHADKKPAPSRPSKTQRQARDETDITELWKEYRERRGLGYSLFRILPQLFFFSLFVVVLYLKIGFPLAPCRGDVCFQIYWGTALLSWLFMLLLLLYVIDTTRLCRRFINILCEKKFPWPENAKIKNEFRYPAVDTKYLNELCCIDLIAKLSAVVSKLLLFPFIILFLLVAARHSYIDNFDWPIWLAVIYGFIAAYAVGVVIALRVTAEKARRGAIEQLEGRLDATSPHRFSWPSRDERKRQIEEVIQTIRNNHEGAFQPFYQYPILGALAVPAGGTGILYLIDYLVQSV